MRLHTIFTKEENKVMLDIILQGKMNGYEVNNLLNICSNYLNKSLSDINLNWDYLKAENENLIEIAEVIWEKQNKPLLENKQGINDDFIKKEDRIRRSRINSNVKSIGIAKRSSSKNDSLLLNSFKTTVYFNGHKLLIYPDYKFRAIS